jgi:hypothetical protein
MTSRANIRLATALFAIAVVAVPSAARAQTWIHGWTLCTPYTSFHSCHSVSLQTDAVLDNTNTRTGTTISIALHNLQGQGYSEDNTTSSGLFEADFLAPSVSLGNYQNYSVGGVPSGGATGTPTWAGNAGMNYGGPPGFVGIYGQDWYGVGHAVPLGGCGTNALLYGMTYGGQTCAPNSSVTFSFTIGGVVDANQFTSALIGVYGVEESAYCISDPSQHPSNPYPACDVRGESLTQLGVVPEPVTIVLLATGLCGIGAARLRRRKKDPQIGA